MLFLLNGLCNLAAEKVGLPTGPPYLSLVSKGEKLGQVPITGVSFASGGAKIITKPNELPFVRTYIPVETYVVFPSKNVECTWVENVTFIF